MRHIFSQGDYDGACFLYALANAYFAVTGHRPSCGAWDRGIRAVQHAHDFLGGCIGTTEHFSSDPQTIPAAVAIMLTSFNSDGPPVQWRQCATACDVQGIAPFIDRRGVVVFRYQGETAQVEPIDHWVCGVAVGRRPIRLHLACSYRKSQDDWQPGGRYRERRHPEIGRYSNNWLASHHDCRIVPGSAFRVWVE